MNEISLGPVLLGLAVFLIVYRFWPQIKSLFKRQSSGRGGWTMYEKWRDLEQFDRYSDRIHDMLFDDFHNGIINGEEYLRWVRRFSFMPGLKPQPLIPVKEAIRSRQKYHYDLRGRRISLYSNNDEVHRKYFPNFSNYLAESPSLVKPKDMFPEFELMKG
jgi:hypothetical protein